MTNRCALSESTTASWGWQLDGLCRGLDVEQFFSPAGERGPARARRELRAKQVCADCPVLQQCRSHALDVREPYGVWGGMSETERATALGRTRPQPIG